MTNLTWHKFKDRKPPFDTRVLVRGWQQYGSVRVVLFAVAYNECWPPHYAMTLLDETARNTELTLTHWAELDEEIWEEDYLP